MIDREVDIMNQRQIILSGSTEKREIIDEKINALARSPTVPNSIKAEILELGKRLQTFESQYQMSSAEFFRRFRAGELEDAMDFFEWSVFYEMWSSVPKNFVL